MSASRWSSCSARNSGETALITGYLTDADRTLISEVPFDIGKVAEFLAKDRAANPSRYAVLVLSEGAQMQGGQIVESGEADAFGHRKLGGIGEMVGAEITRLTGIGVLNQKLGYIMRGGPPDALDRWWRRITARWWCRFWPRESAG